MDVFIVILYYVIWIPLKYAGLGIWWLITIPKRRRERLEEEKELRRRNELRRVEAEEKRRQQEQQIEAQRRQAELKRIEAEEQRRQKEQEQKAREEEERKKRELEKIEGQKRRVQKEQQIRSHIALLESFDTLDLSKKREVCDFLCKMQVALRDDYLAVVSGWVVNGTFCQDKMDLLLEVYQSAESYFELPDKYVELTQNIFSNESDCTADKYAWCRGFLQAELFDSITLPVLCDFETRWILQQGCEPIDCSDPIVNRPCFMSEELRVVYQRQHQGKRYYDIRNSVPTKSYLFADALEFIDEGHWSISLGAILEMRILASESILVITCRNRGGLFLYGAGHILSQLKAKINYLIHNREDE